MPSTILFKPTDGFWAVVDGAYVADARFFAPTETHGSFLVELPSLSMIALVEPGDHRAILVPPADIERLADGLVRLPEPSPREEMVRPFSTDGRALGFHFEASEILIFHGPGCRSIGMPLPTTAPPKDDPAARRCLRQETSTTVPFPNCAKGVNLRNTCDTAVVTVVQTTQHLFSGALAQSTTFLLAPHDNYSMGCAWPTGAVGPTDFTVLAAAFQTDKILVDDSKCGSTRH